MKATQEQIEAVRAALESRVDALREYGRVNRLSPKRVRWDAWWAVPAAVRSVVAAGVYRDGGNDEHIDTLLRRVMTQLGLEEFAR